MEIFVGIVERITFFSEESGWSVLKVAPFVKGQQELVTVVVHQARVFAGATMEFRGEWVEHSKYGTQFKACAVLEQKPASSAALEKYLGSGLIYGVGPKTAKKIVSHFRQDTLDVFEHQMERLREVQGIADAKLAAIRKSWTEHREIRNVMIFLQTHGISTLFAVKIYKRYGNKAIAIVEDNPYRLSRDIYGIGFFSADSIAASLGIMGRDPRRIKAAIQHALASSRDEGHCYLTFEQAHSSLRELLREDALEGELIQGCLLEMAQAEEIKTRMRGETPCYYSKTLFYDEQYVAKKINRLRAEKLTIDGERVRCWLAKFNEQQRFPLSQEQAQSVVGVVGKCFAILTGGPGCGKTTTTKAIVKLALAMGKRVLLAAPTGRAAQRMEEVIGLPSQTLHRLLVWNPSQGGFKRNEENPLEGDFVIVDECSMMDISLSAALLKAIDCKRTQVLFIGDQDQLPSVGAGNVLKDIIASEEVPVFKLTQVFRQAKESLIIRYAHQINRGEMPQIDSPFRDPGLWSRGCDALFIDAEEATQAGMSFLKRAKRILHYRIDREGAGLVETDDSELAKIYREGENFLRTEVSDSELDQFRRGKGEHRVFTVPPKFKHVQLENLLSTSSAAEEVRSVLQRIHPYSSLHYGHTATDMILRLYQDILPKYWGEGLEVQVLAPMTRGPMGTLALNQKIQEQWNASSPAKRQLLVGQKMLRQGDRVIQKKNNYDLEVFNGDIGQIVDVDSSAMELLVRYGGKESRLVTYSKEHLLELDHAYAITIHKSQGSEFDAVIIPIATQHFKLLFRNLIYTGLTRAKKLVVFVGTRRALAMAVKNSDNKKRQTLLRELVQSGR